MKKLLMLLMLLTLATDAWAKTQSGTIAMAFDLTSQKAGEEVSLWIPYPVSDLNQTIANVKYAGDYAEAGVYTDRAYQTPMLYVRWDKAAKTRILNFSFDAERSEVEHRDLPTSEGAWNPADFAQWLKATSLGPIDGEVKKLADKITEGKTGVQAKAHAIYDWICDNMFRDPDTHGCGPGDVCALLLRPGGKCADIHSVFVSLARAAGVPAREIFGIRQGKEGATDISSWQHCWAEFYLPGYGWVPVDPADVRKMMLTQKLKLEDDKTAEYRRYYWGGIDPYRVKLSIGRDLVLGPPQQ
ncbi:transglutaminase-like domain-containing protein, partial [Trichloromonas sp.]|uniref:transglutaminase-like domain-containing protein n=1 Tax=Trichloromonas sp. TaxID=3069249 RepID=UPI003D81435C